MRFDTSDGLGKEFMLDALMPIRVDVVFIKNSYISVITKLQ